MSKLEKGDVVAFIGGGDRWTVIEAPPRGPLVNLERQVYGRFTLDRAIVLTGVDTDYLVLINRPKPKPDYYVNAKGDPLPGDIFTDGHNAVLVSRGDRYEWLSADGLLLGSHPLGAEHGYIHSIGRVSEQRTLVVRAGKPYTG